MTDYTVKRFGLILAQQAIIEGMKAENNQREIRGESMAYTFEDFEKVSSVIENFVYSHDEQL